MDANILFPSINSHPVISHWDNNPPAVIKIIGIGGGGGNAVNDMIRAAISGVEFIAVNTDLQALRESLAPTKIQIGEKISKGLGVGGNPENGRKAAQESIDALKDIVKGADMVFVTAGMGGGTGTGAAPIVAKIAKEADILTVGVVIKPFNFEGSVRIKQAEEGIANINKEIDALIVVQNEKFNSMMDNQTKFSSLYPIVNDVLRQSVQAITDTITKVGIINRDLADIRSILKDAGNNVCIGVGMCENSGDLKEAFDRALQKPLVDNFDISKANKMLITVTSNSETPATVLPNLDKIIKGFQMKNPHTFFGHYIDNNLGDKIKVTIMATGCYSHKMPKSVLLETNPVEAKPAAAPVQKELFDDEIINFTEPAYLHYEPKKLNQ